MTDENGKLRAENETLRETKKAEVDIVKRSYKVKIAGARRVCRRLRFDTEVKKVVSLKFSYIDCIIFNLTWFEFYAFNLFSGDLLQAVELQVANL